MKIKDFTNEPIKRTIHEVGNVYKGTFSYYLLVKTPEGNFRFIDLDTFQLLSSVYTSLEQVDKQNQGEILVDAELVIREVK